MKDFEIPEFEEIEKVNFRQVRKGYNPKEVEEYNEKMLALFNQAQEKIGQLQEDLILTERQLEKAKNLDETTLTEHLGGAAARLLNAARKEAETRNKEAEIEAEEILQQAKREAEEIQTRAEQAFNERIEAAKAESKHLQAEALAVRQKTLREMGRRKKEDKAQIERLRAGRDRLLKSIEDSQNVINDIRENLTHSLSEAKIAADEAARKSLGQPEPTIEELEQEIATAKLLELAESTLMPNISKSDAEPSQTDTFSETKEQITEIHTDEKEMELMEELETGQDLQSEFSSTPAWPPAGTPAGRGVDKDVSKGGDAEMEYEVDNIEIATTEIEPSEPESDAVVIQTGETEQWEPSTQEATKDDEEDKQNVFSSQDSVDDFETVVISSDIDYESISEAETIEEIDEQESSQKSRWSIRKRKGDKTPPAEKLAKYELVNEEPQSEVDEEYGTDEFPDKDSRTHLLFEELKAEKGKTELEKPPVGNSMEKDGAAVTPSGVSEDTVSENVASEDAIPPDIVSPDAVPLEGVASEIDVAPPPTESTIIETPRETFPEATDTELEPATAVIEKEAVAKKEEEIPPEKEAAEETKAEAITDLSKTLERQLKQALALDQNQVLDGLRQSRKKQPPALESQIKTYTTAINTQELEKVFGNSIEIPNDLLVELWVNPLRESLEKCFEDNPTDPQKEIRNSYRDFKQNESAKIAEKLIERVLGVAQISVK